MRPRERRENGEQDLFCSQLDQIIEMKHPLVRPARTIDWSFLEARFIRKAPAGRRCRPC
jgi:transposase, IS5 family